MPALPWTSIVEPDADRSYVGFVTKLPLTAHRHVPGFLRDTMRIRRQLAAAPGLVGDALRRRAGGHDVLDRVGLGRRGVVAHLRRRRTAPLGDAPAPARMGASVFRTFAVTGRELPLTWPASKDRVS